ncbi:hypothetical protein L6164_028590 [Bauhinia variegata]|uniref:Uncharacterized protein n=1 Tax=Bauhinia variegata TaxID=167791 RepID=A0ACB9L678_BAUVA|nr:hypothetical protein L6164_028590 [Bauhinia variegata]
MKQYVESMGIEDDRVKAKQELQRRGVKNVDEAIVVAESLTEFERGKGDKSDTSKPKSSKPCQGKDWGDKGKGVSKYDDRGSDGKSLQKKQPEKKSYSGPLSCYVCKGPHRMKDCPELGSLAAMVEEKEKYEEPPGTKLSSLRLLNTIKAKPSSKSEGLMYVNAKLNGKPVSVMVDTGATHNFITPEEATRIGLNVAQGGGWVKTMNSSPKQFNGIARGVELCLP